MFPEVGNNDGASCNLLLYVGVAFNSWRLHVFTTVGNRSAVLDCCFTWTSSRRSTELTNKKLFNNINVLTSFLLYGIKSNHPCLYIDKSNKLYVFYDTFSIYFIFSITLQQNESLSLSFLDHYMSFLNKTWQMETEESSTNKRLFWLQK